MIVRVFLPGQLRNPLNGSWGGWQKHARLARDMRDRATTALYLATTPAQRTEIIRNAATPKLVTFRAFVVREWDDDAVPAAIKPYRDALVTMRLIDDDRPSAGHRFVYAQTIEKGKRGVEIVVEPAP